MSRPQARDRASDSTVLVLPPSAVVAQRDGSDRLDQSWDGWTTRGRTALLGGDVDGAVVAFGRAARAARDSGQDSMSQQLREVEGLARRVAQLRRRREAHRTAQAMLEVTEHRILAQLLDRVAQPGPEIHGAVDHPVHDTVGAARVESVPALRAADPIERRAGLRRLGGGPELAVQLLGPVGVSVDGVPVQSWAGGRSRSLLAYLLTHRAPFAACEVLMEVFWPGSPAAAARNSLHVAIHGLRRALRTATDLPVIVRAGDGYRLDPGLRVWLDVETFDDHLAHAREFEQHRERDAALLEYEAATALYRGDYLAESPYEDWVALPRERLHLAYLDALTRLSSNFLDLHRHAACETLCHAILDRDPCNEDTRRRLMRCHSRAGHPHLALTEYRRCAAVLADQLGIGPDPDTVALRDRIGRREPV